MYVVHTLTSLTPVYISIWRVRLLGVIGRWLSSTLLLHFMWLQQPSSQEHTAVRQPSEQSSLVTNQYPIESLCGWPCVEWSLSRPDVYLKGGRRKLSHWLKVPPLSRKCRFQQE